MQALLPPNCSRVQQQQ